MIRNTENDIITELRQLDKTVSFGFFLRKIKRSKEYLERVIVCTFSYRAQI